MIKKLRYWWKLAKIIEKQYYRRIEILEKKMAKDVGIKDIELFHCDGSLVGIGNYSRTMKLIHSEKLEKVKVQ